MTTASVSTPLTDELVEQAATAISALARTPDFLAGVRFAEQFYRNHAPASERAAFECAVKELREWPEGHVAAGFFDCWDSGDYKADWLQSWWRVWIAARATPDRAEIERRDRASAGEAQS